MKDANNKRKLKYSSPSEMPKKKTKFVSAVSTCQGSSSEPTTKESLNGCVTNSGNYKVKNKSMKNKLQSSKKTTCSKLPSLCLDSQVVHEKNKTTCASLPPAKTPGKESFIHHKPDAVSSNWKALLKSGKVSYNKKIETKKVDPIDVSAAGKEKESEIWFDDVDEVLLDLPKPKPVMNGDSLVKTKAFDGLTKIIGMDCEMVGVGDHGKESVLARVSIVNHFGHCLYDTFVKPVEKVTDYRTKFSGVRPSDLVNAEEFKTVQKKVADLLNGRILVGHALHNDLQVLFLSHPRKEIRDTSVYKPFRDLVRGGRPSLKKLTSLLLGVEVQQGEHNSIEDAQAAMRLYTLHRKEWEKSLKLKFHGKRKPLKKTSKSDDQNLQKKSYTSM